MNKRVKDVSSPGRRLFFHLGYPKTASTFLKEKILKRQDRINYLGKPYPGFTLTDLFLERTSIEDAASYLRDNYQAEKINIISDENALSPLNQFGMEISLEQRLNTLESLLSSFDPVYLVSIRKPESLIMSYLTQTVDRHPEKAVKHSLTLSDFFSSLNSRVELHAPATQYFNSFFHIDHFVTAIRQRGSVHILWYEMLQEEPVSFLKSLEEIFATYFNWNLTLADEDMVGTSSEVLNQTVSSDLLLREKNSGHAHVVTKRRREFGLLEEIDEEKKALLLSCFALDRAGFSKSEQSYLERFGYPLR